LERGGCRRARFALVDCDASGCFAHVDVAVFAVHDAKLLQTRETWQASHVDGGWQRGGGSTPGNSRLPGSFTRTFPFCL
jgi:hypothetical protein